MTSAVLVPGAVALAPVSLPSGMPIRLVGAIEAGGTKFQCALARGVEEVLVSERIATTTPDETLGSVLRFFTAAQREFGLAQGFGIASFGPVDLKTGSPTWGHILPTPKPGWAGADLIGPLAREYEKPIALDTDVNAAALAEWGLTVDRSLNSLVYITVGTGIGGGVIIDGRPVHGLMHSEMGHIKVRRDPRDVTFAGICPFHGDCLEGLACGPAIKARWGKPLNELDSAHPAAAIVGGYLGQLAATIALMLSSERIVVGGGVMASGAMLPHVRSSAKVELGGYLPHAAVRGELEEYIVPSRLGDRSGLWGAVLLALQAIDAGA